MRCTSCKSDEFVTTESEIERQIAGRAFLARLPAKRCTNCGEDFMEAKDLLHFELAAAAELARRGPFCGAAYQFMRKALGLKALELAELLDVAPETISRWENDKLAIEHRALALLASLVIERQEGRQLLQERLRQLRTPGSPPPRVHLVPHVA